MCKHFRHWVIDFVRVNLTRADFPLRAFHECVVIICSVADALEIFLVGVYFRRIFVAEGIFENGNLTHVIVGLHGMTHHLLFGCVAQEFCRICFQLVVLLEEILDMFTGIFSSALSCINSSKR